MRVPHAAGDNVVTVAGRRIPIYGLPRGSLRALVPPRNDPRLDRALRSQAVRVTADVGVYVHRADGGAAAWNAGAEFEGASTLKLPIMVAALERIGGEPRATAYWTPFTAITRASSNNAADEALELLGGSEVGGSARMVAAMRRLGLRHTYLYGGYLTDPGVGGGPQRRVRVLLAHLAPVGAELPGAEADHSGLAAHPAKAASLHLVTLPPGCYR